VTNQVSSEKQANLCVAVAFTSMTQRSIAKVFLESQAVYRRFLGFNKHYFTQKDAEESIEIFENASTTSIASVSDIGNSPVLQFKCDCGDEGVPLEKLLSDLVFEGTGVGVDFLSRKASLVQGVELFADLLCRGAQNDTNTVP